MKLLTKRSFAKGFTLVELLIVIALLGVIATIVIAAINPIEQANRASDGGMKADASQIISAIQRYYVSHSAFPWNDASCTGGISGNCDSGSGSSPDDAFDASGNFVSADDAAVGICGASGAACRTTSADGILVSALELQKTFQNKNWVGAVGQFRLMVGKATGASSAVYVCWVPKSTSNRQNVITENRVYDLTKPLTGAGIPAAGTCTTPADAGWKTGACAECVP